MCAFNRLRDDTRYNDLGVIPVIDSLSPVEEADRALFREASARVNAHFRQLGVHANTDSFNPRSNLYASASGRAKMLNKKKQPIWDISFLGLHNSVDRSVTFKISLRNNRKEFSHVARHELIHWAAKTSDVRSTACGEERLVAKSGFSLQKIPLNGDPPPAMKDRLVNYVEGIVDKAARDSGVENIELYFSGIQLVERILSVVSGGDPGKRDDLWRQMLQDYIDGTTHHFQALIEFYNEPRLPRLLARFSADELKPARLLFEFADASTTPERRKKIVDEILREK